MLTCRAIINRALRKLTYLPAGENPSADVAASGLASLQSIYLGLIGSGAFGRQNDVLLTETEYTPFEQDRIISTNILGSEITFPAAFTPGDVAEIRPVYDGSIVTITDQYSAFSRNYIYDAYIGRWTLIESLTLNSRAPFADRYAEGLASRVAILLAPGLSIPVQKQVEKAARAFGVAISHRHDRPVRPGFRTAVTPIVVEIDVAEFEDESVALFDEMVSAPSVGRKIVINDLIVGLKTDGVWTKLDLLQIYCAHTQQAASLNWVDPDGPCTAGAGLGAPTFAANLGWTFAGSPDYINTNFIPGTHGVAMAGGAIVNEMVGVYERTNVSSGSAAIGGQSAPAQSMVLRPRNVGSFAVGLNCTFTVIAGPVTDSRGLTVAQREAADTMTVYKNGVSAASNGTATGSPTLSTVALFVGARNNNATPDQHRATTIGAVMAGGRLTAGEQLALYTHLQTYMSAIGANV